MMPFSTIFLQGVPGNSDCINPCAENIPAAEADPAAPVPSEPDLPDGESLRDEQELLIDRIETQRMSHMKVHHQCEIAGGRPEMSADNYRILQRLTWPRATLWQSRGAPNQTKRPGRDAMDPAETSPVM
jgi:hypothetical protein